MERKLYPCKNCGSKVPIRSKGLCPQCRQNQRASEGTLPQYKNKIKKVTTKNSIKRKTERGCLPAFFQFHIELLEKVGVSDESGQYIGQPSAANIAHILPKRKSGGFPSVQCNVDNVLYLTIQEHNRFDKLLDERNFEQLEIEFPNSWKKACIKLKKLMKVCTERNKLYFSLEEYLKNK